MGERVPPVIVVPLGSGGIYIEPTSAAAFAGWYKLLPSEKKGAVVVLTGTSLKETNKIGNLML